MSRRLLLSLLIGVPALSAASFGAFVWNADREQAALVENARAALELGEYPLAGALSRQALARDPDSAAALLVAAEAALASEEFDEAAECFRRLPNQEKRAREAHLSGASAALERFHLSEAERHLGAALALAPGHVDANRQLARLLNAAGRRREAAPFLLRLIQAANFSVEELLLLTDLDETYFDLPLLEKARAAHPADPVPLVGLARARLLENDAAASIELLRRAVSLDSNLLEAQAWLGRALLDLGDDPAWLRWQANLPEHADSHTEIWFVRGSFAERQGRIPEAIRCYAEASRRDADHVRAAFRLGQLLTSSGETAAAASFLERAHRLTQLHDELHPIFLTGPRTEPMLRAAALLEELGRPWEAWAWCFAAAAYDPQHVAAIRARDRLRDVLARNRPPRMLAAANPSRGLDLALWPLPRWGEMIGGDMKATPSRTPAPRFEEVAGSVGIDFAYFNSGDSNRVGKRMFETTGGGVAAFDFDADGRPDLHFTQGCVWPPVPGQRDHLDRLYRNLGERFTDVTNLAGVSDERYSQGLATGDVDGDGFADLYIGNIGRNRLYRNNGDGTFSDMTHESGLEGEAWTSSCVIADLDSDGHPEIFDVNYLRGEEIFERLCGARMEHPCAPDRYHGAPDQLFQSTGDGRWFDVTSAAGLGGLLGKGLGVVAADFDGSGRLSLFVGNDGEANFYLANHASAPGGGVRLAEEALLRGLAFDRDGIAMASMGIAADDANGDGRLDLFVTAFSDDANTLYLQQPGTLFLDATRDAGLHDPSWQMLGFGAQFLDAELDGLPDLVVANGHIDDYGHEGKQYHMPPQFFRNRGEAAFEEIAAAELGPWFAGRYLGRGLAKLDWNRDGLEDFAISRLDGPAALVTNRTESAGRYLALRLAGTASARDAIGTTVALKADGRVRVHQLTAGNGYQAANERRLVFGLGDDENADELTIRWPAGTTQTYSNLAASQEYLAVEGRGRLLSLSTDR